MKSFLFTISWLVALGTAHASQSHAGSTLGLSQNLGGKTLVMALNTVSTETPGNRAAAATAAKPSADTVITVDGAGFELESGLLLALAGVMALLIVSRRRMPR